MSKSNQSKHGPQACARSILSVVPPLMRSIGSEVRRGGAGLSMPQFRALGEIERHPGCSLSDVAEETGLALPAASKCVQTLVQRKLVKREPAASDRRRVILTVTDKGQMLRQAVFDQARGYLAKYLDVLTSEERGQVVEAMQLLERVTAKAARVD